MESRRWLPRQLPGRDTAPPSAGFFPRPAFLRPPALPAPRASRAIDFEGSRAGPLGCAVALSRVARRPALSPSMMLLAVEPRALDFTLGHCLCK